MEKIDFEKGNKALAEYLGFKKSEFRDEYMMNLPSFSSNYYMTLMQLQFHVSWDYLSHAVNAIPSDRKGNLIKLVVGKSFANNDIKTAYKAIVEYVIENPKPKVYKLVKDFVNKVNPVLDNKYFPDVKVYLDRPQLIASHYQTELHSNGVTSYSQLITKLSKIFKDTEENIHGIVSQFVEDFGDYEFKPR